MKTYVLKNVKLKVTYKIIDRKAIPKNKGKKWRWRERMMLKKLYRFYAADGSLKHGEVIHKCAIQLGRTDGGTQVEWYKMETRRKFLKKVVFATLLTAVLIFFILF